MMVGMIACKPRAVLRVLLVSMATFTAGYLFLIDFHTATHTHQHIMDTNERSRYFFEMAKSQIDGSNMESFNGSTISVLTNVLSARPNYTYPIPHIDESCYLLDKLSGEGMPDIHSVFIDNIAGHVVWNGLRFLVDKTGDIEYAMLYPNGVLHPCDPVIQDERNIGWMPQYMVVITCDLPVMYRDAARITVSLVSSENNCYGNVTVCTSGASLRNKPFLAICTMLRSVDDFVPQWLDFHRYLGVDHVYLYDNELKEDTTLPETVKQYIDEGFVTWIPWHHSISLWKTYLEVQIAHENDCMWRHKYDVEWMIKIDVDEYVQPMNPNKTQIPDYLHDPMYENLAGVRLENWFFGRPKRIGPKGTEVIQRNVWSAKEPTLQQTGHDKNILRPMNVHYFKIHNVKLGGDMISLNPYTELRMVHYRSDNKRALHFELPDFVFRDFRMMQILKKARGQWDQAEEERSQNIT